MTFIKHENAIRQIVKYDGMDYGGNRRPTDIDGFMEFRGEDFILYPEPIELSTCRVREYYTRNGWSSRLAVHGLTVRELTDKFLLVCEQKRRMMP